MRCNVEVFMQSWVIGSVSDTAGYLMHESKSVFSFNWVCNSSVKSPLGRRLICITNASPSVSPVSYTHLTLPTKA